MELEGGRNSLFRFDVISGPEMSKELESLLNQAFSVSSGATFFDDFPVWDERHGLQVNRIGAFRGQKLISCASVRLASLKTPTGPLPVALIGCVATHKDWRGHGLASETVSRAVAWAKNGGAVAAFLWGSEHRLYRRQGFELCGEQVRVPLKNIEFIDVDDSVNVKQGWSPDLMKVLQKREGGLVVSNSDEAWLSSHKNVNWYFTTNHGEVEAYLAVGRGIDLEGLIHEWGGRRESLIRLLNIVRRSNPHLELLGSPALFRRYEIRFDPTTVEFLCMAKVFEPSKLFSAFRPLGTFDFSFMDELSIVRVLLGPVSVLNIQNGFLPLPVWIWGLDGA